MGPSAVCPVGSCPVASQWPFQAKAFNREICPLFPLQCSGEVCMRARVHEFSPSPSSNLTSLPSFPFSFTPSQLCSLTHSVILSRAEKTGRAAPRSGSPRPQVNPRGRHFWRATQGAASQGAVEETWRWSTRRFIACRSTDFLICFLRTKVTS